MDASNINRLAGYAGSFTQADGAEVAHKFWFGADSLGRDTFSRVLFGTRVSLLIGACAAAISVSIGALLGMLAGMLACWLAGWLFSGYRHDTDAGYGRTDGDPCNPDSHRSCGRTSVVLRS